MNIVIKKTSILLILLIFALLCAGYGISTDFGLFPDENQHMGYVLDVAKNGFPNYVSGTAFGTGKLNNLEHPALYYIITGALEKIAFMFDYSLVGALRIVNFFISVATLIIIYLSLKACKVRESSAFVAILCLISIPMFVLLSSAVNNDPLMILGCAFIFHGVSLYYNNYQARTILYSILLGGLIVSLTKATGALTTACFLFFFVLIENTRLVKKYDELKRVDIIIVVVCLLSILAYYSAIHSLYGKFFPSPQGDPSVWYQTEHPDAVRYTLKEYIVAFYHSNIATLLTPYGHKPFEDYDLRRVLLGVTLSLFPILSAFVIYKHLKDRSGIWRFVLISSISFGLFMLFYFITVHRMNTRTGYPGAMQARYFFGFLPAMVIIYGLAFENIKSNVVRGLLAMLILCTSILSFYPSYYPLINPSYGQITADTTYGELTNAHIFEQTFTARYSNIKKIDLLLGTYARTNTGIITLEIVDNTGNLLGTSDLSLEKIADNAWSTFMFKPFTLQKGHEYKIRLTARQSIAGNAITWYAFKGQAASPKFKGTPYGPTDEIQNRYPFGHAFIDGSMIDANFCFKIYGDIGGDIFPTLK